MMWEDCSQQKPVNQLNQQQGVYKVSAIWSTIINTTDVWPADS